MAVVLDTDVVVSGLRSPQGASAELLRRVLTQKLTILLSVPLGIEYEAVCLRPEHLLAADATANDMLNAVDAIIAQARPVDIHYQWRPQLHDANDEIVLEAAVNGGASAIVTYNTKDFRQIPQRFGIELMTPKQLIERRSS
ncbi:MAG: putative toxin-antitoxin system toxin component, PIN family [Pseudomonadota bacterium]